MPDSEKSSRMNNYFIERAFLIKNELGVHARAAALFVKTANKFKSRITVKRNNYEVNGKSIMGLLTLAASKGMKIIVRAEGEDAEEAIESIGNLIENNFYE